MKQLTTRLIQTVLSLSLVVALAGTGIATAASVTDNPQSGSVGLEGKISAPPPKRGATITVPGNGAAFNAMPITISGLCPDNLLVKIFSNNVFIGAAQCKNGSYSIQANLFSGRNDIVAKVYDALNQEGPDSNVATVTFNDGQFAQFGTRVSLTSSYAKRGANPGDTLTWPIGLSGGVGPYAISVDWGDGSTQDLISQKFPGTFNIKHIYQTAGVYEVVVKATDANGTAAFLQLVGVGNGQAAQATQTTDKENAPTAKTKVLWWPAAALIPLIIAAFWLGRRHELFAIRRNIEKNSAL